MSSNRARASRQRQRAGSQARAVDDGARSRRRYRCKTQGGGWPRECHAAVQLDKLAFLAWVQGREGRYELAGGRVVMMVGASRGHAVIVMNLAALIRAQIDPRLAVLADFGLDVGENTLRYPDIMVDRAGGGVDDYTATAPVLVAEVLSPSTAEVDLGDKAALPGLEAYLVLAQDEPKAWIRVRRDGRFPPAPQVVAGLDKTIHISTLKLELPLGALNAGL